MTISKKKVLYSKRFDLISHIPAIFTSENHTLPYSSGKKFLEHYSKTISYIPLPEKILKKQDFINTAIALSEEYQYDTDIIEYPTHLSVDIYTVPCCFKDDLKTTLTNLFLLGDEILFSAIHSEPCILLITIIYNTHKLVTSL